MKRTSRYPIIAALFLLATGCAKEVGEELGLIPTGCGSDGARLEAIVNGTSWCADANLTAAANGDEILVNGITITGGTLTFQLDSMAVGVHPLNEGNNSVLLTTFGLPYLSTDTDPGVITVLAHDTAANRLQAEFTVTLHTELDGSNREVSGSMDVTYVE